MTSSAVALPLDAPAAPARVGRRRPRLLASLRARSSTILALAILATVIGCGLFAPLIAPHAPRTGNVMDSKLPPVWLADGDVRFLLGTDELGRDILSRVMFGAQISLGVGFTAVVLAGAIGISLGLVAGYFRGLVDDTIMRLVDVQLAVPQILLAIALLAALGPGLQNVC